MKALSKKVFSVLCNRETVTYLVFGVIATALNIVLYHLFVNVMGMSTALGNLLDTVICVLFQYFTNRIWVFRSKNRGMAALHEFGQFVAARVVTAVIDEAIMVVGVNLLIPRFVALPLQKLAGVGVKVLSNGIVIVLNYIFSKLFVFKDKAVNA